MIVRKQRSINQNQRFSVQLPSLGKTKQNDETNFDIETVTVTLQIFMRATILE